MKTGGIVLITGAAGGMGGLFVTRFLDTDRVERLHRDAPLNKAGPATFYGVWPKGYADYPMLADTAPA